MVKLAILGLGFMGRTHLEALSSIPQGDVVAVASDDPAALAGDLTRSGGNLGDSGGRFDFSRMRRYADWREAVADPDVEAVDICLPTDLHASAAIAALQAGKHVLVEKPLALNADEADSILDTAARSDRLLMTAQVLRFFPEYLPLVELQDSGRLGAMRMALFRRRCALPGWGSWLPDTAKSGGAILDLLIHDVDMMIRLFGLPEAVSASGHADLASGIDVLTARCHYPDGATAIITGGWHHAGAYPFSMEYTVTGDQATVEYSSQGRPPTLYRADGNHEQLDLQQTDGYRSEIEYFLDCAVQGREAVRCPPEESAAAVKLARLLINAREQNGERIACNL